MRSRGRRCTTGRSSEVCDGGICSRKNTLAAWDSGAERGCGGTNGALGDLKTFEQAVKKYVGYLPLTGCRAAGISGIGGSFVEDARDGAGGGAGIARRLFRALENGERGATIVGGVKSGLEIAGTHEALGYCYFRDGEFAEAQEEMQRTIASGMDHLDCSAGIARAAECVGDRERR